MQSEFKKWILKNSHGIEIHVLEIGAAIQKWIVPINGERRDIVLGLSNPVDYLDNKSSYGIIAGRFANRINKGQFKINGKEYQLSINSGRNHLHGGLVGFGRRSWSGLQFGNGHLRLTYFSPDGEEGYPGNLDVRIDFMLNDLNELIIKYWARTDKDTIINLTNHSYFNLLGHQHGDINDHLIEINSKGFTQVDQNLIPTGSTVEIKDLMNKKAVQELIKNNFNEEGGIDHNFILEDEKAVVLESPAKDLTLSMETSEPGIQVFTSNFNDITYLGKDNVTYGHHSGIALETQHFPDSPNHPLFPTTLLKEGQEFTSQTKYCLEF